MEEEKFEDFEGSFFETNYHYEILNEKKVIEIKKEIEALNCLKTSKASNEKSVINITENLDLINKIEDGEKCEHEKINPRS